MLMVATLLGLLPSPHSSNTAGRVDGEGSSPPSIDAVRDLIPDATAREEIANEKGLWAVQRDDNSQPLWIARTMPIAAKALGYRGPTEAILALDSDGVITRVGVLQSHDTDEHVAAVETDNDFLSQFIGLSWNAKDNNGDTPTIDGVSGATLTSLAMAEGILARLGASSTSLLFNKPLRVSEIGEISESATLNITDPVATIRSPTGVLESIIIRTGPFSDEVIGYQGPTELILSFDDNAKLRSIRIRESLDNEPYVTYVRDEDYFWNSIQGKTLSELASWNPVDEGVEGVSGATMTSLAIAESLPQIAAKIETSGGLERWTLLRPPPWSWAWARESLAETYSEIRFSARDTAVICLLVLLGLTTKMGWMRQRRLRLAWLTLTVIVIGFWTGNLISLSLIMGWASSGVCWTLAIGLVAIVATALASPPLTRGNPYCNHLCPHGAIQQLVRPSTKSRRHQTLSPRWAKRLFVIAPLTLVVAYLVLLFWPTTDVSGVEPFHAYLWPMAAASSVVLCVVTLLVSLRVPMAYCRMGCPTGFLLGYLRRTSASHRITRYDMGLVSLLAVSLIKVWIS
ncbi:membrane bound regulatory protein [Rhodopirellula sp. SWK7]|nr:membrane bound regulatory protein [Rhodopirellula sp. SWK7]